MVVKGLIKLDNRNRLFLTIGRFMAKHYKLKVRRRGDGRIVSIRKIGLNHSGKITVVNTGVGYANNRLHWAITKAKKNQLSKSQLEHHRANHRKFMEAHQRHLEALKQRKQSAMKRT